MTMRWKAYGAVGLAAVALVAAIGLITQSSSDEETTLSALAERTHFHGIAVDGRDPSRLYLATHHGLYLADSSGKAWRISETIDDLMGFTPHPDEASVLYASGHPIGGGNLGFVASKDGGETWTKLSNGVGGPVDFHQMDISKADPKVIYGVYRGLQRSTDGGLTWSRIGNPPDGLLQLAASSHDADTLYAATEQGLLRSPDSGVTWHPTHALGRAATMVHVTHDGDVFAYLVGTGLIRAAEHDLAWQRVSNDFGGEYVLHFVVDPTDQRRFLAVTFSRQTRAQAVRASHDAGATWTRIGSE